MQKYFLESKSLIKTTLMAQPTGTGRFRRRTPWGACHWELQMMDLYAVIRLLGEPTSKSTRPHGCFLTLFAIIGTPIKNLSILKL